MLTEQESIENIREEFKSALGVIRKGDKIQLKLREEIKEQQNEINLLKEQVAILKSIKEMAKNEKINKNIDMKKVYVVTDPELGWDCVVDVCSDKDYVNDHYSSSRFVISEKKINDKVLKKSKIVIPIYDEKTMSCFADGSIGGDSEYSPSQSDIENFCKVVKNFGDDKIYVVYSKVYKYHFIALEGIADDDLDWSDEINDLFTKLVNHLTDNDIIFG
jgi:hypothetical protein